MLCVMSRSRLVPVTITAAAVALMLTGCGPSGGPSGSPSASPSSSASASPSPTPTASSASGDACTRDSLKITYQATDNSAGHFHGILTFTNTSASACTMNGYPIVFIGQPGADQPMGGASTNDTTSTAALVTLPAGGTAHAAITITDAGAVCDNPIDTTYLIAAPPLDHPVDVAADGEQVDNVSISGCNDAAVSLVQVGAVTN